MRRIFDSALSRADRKERPDGADRFCGWRCSMDTAPRRSLRLCMVVVLWSLSWPALVLAAPFEEHFGTRQAAVAPETALAASTTAETASAASAAVTAAHSPVPPEPATSTQRFQQPSLFVPDSPSALLQPEPEPSLLSSEGPSLRALITARWVTASGFYVQRGRPPLTAPAALRVEDPDDAPGIPQAVNPAGSPALPASTRHEPYVDPLPPIAGLPRPLPPRIPTITAGQPVPTRAPEHMSAQATPQASPAATPPRLASVLALKPTPTGAPPLRPTPAMNAKTSPKQLAEQSRKAGNSRREQKAAVRETAVPEQPARPAQRTPGELAYSLDPRRPSPAALSESPDQTQALAESRTHPQPSPEPESTAPQPDRTLAVTGGSGNQDRRQRGGFSGEHTAALSPNGSRTVRAEAIYGNMVTDFRARAASTPQVNRHPKDDIFLPYLGVGFTF